MLLVESVTAAAARHRLDTELHSTSPSSSVAFFLHPLLSCWTVWGLTGPPPRPTSRRHLSTFPRMNGHTKTQRTSISLEGKIRSRRAQLRAKLIFHTFCFFTVQKFDLCLFFCFCFSLKRLFFLKRLFTYLEEIRCLQHNINKQSHNQTAASRVMWPLMCLD